MWTWPPVNSASIRSRAIMTSSAAFGMPPSPRREEIAPVLLALVDGVCAGETGGLGRATPIRDARTGEVVRD